MPKHAPNKMPPEVKRRYFELIRQGLSGSAASSQVGVSLSCGSLWFIDAGSVDFVDKPISRRYLTQDDRIEIADGLAAGEPVKAIAARIGKSYQSVYREISRNRKPNGRYQPWYATAKPTNVGSGPGNAGSPSIRRSGTSWQESLISIGHQPKSAGSGAAGQNAAPWHVCTETIYEAVYRGLIAAQGQPHTSHWPEYRHKRGRGRNGKGH
jgi:IS30 family transposase